MIISITNVNRSERERREIDESYKYKLSVAHKGKMYSALVTEKTELKKMIEWIANRKNEVDLDKETSLEKLQQKVITMSEDDDEELGC